MTPDSEISREWFAQKPSHVPGQLELNEGSPGPSGTGATRPRRPLTAREAVARFLHTTTTTKGTHEHHHHHQSAPQDGH
jgi:hypothetical protein